ncbi:MAG TPA: hypothetical protein VFN48_05505 [Solirubrobacteraceae bacterium]|nr:hypothetical protein [Solirubrobacteraceae bacterium]
MSGTGPVEQETIKREVNEAIERGLWPGEQHEMVRMRCECGHVGCADFLEISAAEYERVRADGRRFLITPGHEKPEIEHVVARRPSYSVVEKDGVAGRVAEAADPRDPGSS